MSVAEQPQKFVGKYRSVVHTVPPGFIEYGFYAILVYDSMGPILGVGIDKLGIVMWAGLACLCFLGFREWPVGAFKTLFFPLGLTISYLIIQLMYHGESINQGYVKSFIPWIFTLIVVQAISFRQGFFHRFAIFSVILGVSVLPFLEFRAYGKEEMTRVALEAGLGFLSNANAMGNWFGFCTVYFFVFGVVSQRQKPRLVSWIIAVGCLFILTLSVSRGALLATVIGIVLGSREFLKRGFLPVMLLVILAGIAYGAGVFDQAIDFYIMRGTKETGRGLIWPLAFQNFINSPLIGVGASNLKVFLPMSNMYMTPHNGFLFIASTSGIITLMFYTAYWGQAIWAAIKQQAERTYKAPFLLPMVAYVFIISCLSNVTFMGPLVVVTIAAAVTSRIPTRPAPPSVVRRKK